MLHFARRSLLYQLLSVYLLFVIVVLAGGLGVNAVVGEQLLTEAQASDEALAQEIALETSRQLLGFENSVVTLSKLIVQNGVSTAPQTMARAFQAFRAARSDASQTSQSDVDHIYWL